jgi:hypothetical protein
MEFSKIAAAVPLAREAVTSGKRPMVSTLELSTVTTALKRCGLE